MKKKKLLENPVVVVLLCVVAGAAIFFNAVAPLLKNNRPDADAAGEAATVIPDEVPGAAEPPPESAADPAAMLTDTMTLSDLHRIGWKHPGMNNPFTFIDTTRVKLSKVTPNDSAIVSVAAQQTRSKVRTIRPNGGGGSGPQAAERSPLLAISQGSSGFVALVGAQIVRVGDTCEAGVVRSIDRSSVTLHTPRGPRILRLTTSNQGAAQ